MFYNAGAAALHCFASLPHWVFEFVSYFEIRILDFHYLDSP